MKKVKLSQISKIDWGNTKLTKSSFIEDGHYLGVSAAGCDGRMNHSEHDIGTLVISAIGVNCGKMFFPKEKFTAIKNTITITPTTNINSKFLFYYLNSSSFKRRGAGQPFIAKKDTENKEIPLPPLNQQLKIASILDQADVLVQKSKALIAKYEELTQSLFLEMFGDPVSNPKGWKKVELAALCSKITDGTHKTPNYQEEGITFLSAKNIKNYNLNRLNPKYISLDEHKVLSKRCPVGFGDILLTKSGSLGMAAMIEFEFEFSIFESLALIKYNRDKNNGKFLLYFMNTPSTQFQYNGMTKGVGVKHLHLTDIRKLKTISPPIEMQNHFAEHVKEIEVQKTVAQKSLEQSEALFNSLLQKAFKGGLI